MSEKSSKTSYSTPNNNEFLRNYMDELKAWPIDSPPTKEELNALKNRYRVTLDEEDKIKSLAEKHIQRGQESLDKELTIQAIEEFSRAAQLVPLAPEPKIKLTGVLLDEIITESFNQIKKEKIIILLNILYTLDPHNPQVKELRTRSNKLFRQKAGFRRFVFPIIATILFITALLLSQSWFISFMANGANQLITTPVTITDTSHFHTVTVDTTGLKNNDINLDIINATAGNRYDESWMQLTGRLKPLNKGFHTLTLGIQGRGDAGKLLFQMPWSVLKEKSPVLLHGDTLPVQTRRLLEHNANDLKFITFNLVDKTSLKDDIPVNSIQTDFEWDTPRPQGSHLSVELRNPRWIEAFDRQIFKADLAVTNVGSTTLGLLVLLVASGSDTTNIVQLANPDFAPMLMGERRTAAVSISAPLDAEHIQPIIKINNAQESMLLNF